jgi:hypothetical protein
MGPVVRIDRISLRVPGADRDLAARLAQLVAERLVPTLALGPGETVLERLEVEFPARTGESPDSLADRIAARIAAQAQEAWR